MVIRADQAELDWTATKVRSRHPAAENAASFPFEIEAPPGVDIVEASTLAAVPDASRRDAELAQRRSFDHTCLRLPIEGPRVTHRA